jgi:hypothetical protein
MDMEICRVLFQRLFTLCRILIAMTGLIVRMADAHGIYTTRQIKG